MEFWNPIDCFADIVQRHTNVFWQGAGHSVRHCDKEAVSPFCSLARSKAFTIFSCQREEHCTSLGLIFWQSTGKKIKYKKIRASINHCKEPAKRICKALCGTTSNAFFIHRLYSAVLPIMVHTTVHVCQGKQAGLWLILMCRWLLRRHVLIWAETDAGRCAVTLL